MYFHVWRNIVLCSTIYIIISFIKASDDKNISLTIILIPKCELCFSSQCCKSHSERFEW